MSSVTDTSSTTGLVAGRATSTLRPTKQVKSGSGFRLTPITQLLALTTSLVAEVVRSARTSHAPTVGPGTTLSPRAGRPLIETITVLIPSKTAPE